MKKISDLINKATAWISRLWSSIKPDAEKALIIGMKITDAVKNAVNHPVADILTAIIPGDVDDKIKARLRDAAPKAIITLGLAQQCSNETDPAKIIECASRTLQNIKDSYLGEEAYGSLCDSFAVMMAQVAADGKVSWDDFKYVSKWFFDNVYYPKYASK